MSIAIRPFIPEDAEYEAMVGINNANWPDELSAVESLKYRDKTRNPKFLFHRVVGEVGGKIVGYGGCLESEWCHKPGKYVLWVQVHPDHQRNGYGSAIYDHLVEFLEAHDPIEFGADTREDRAECIRFLENRGFESVMRYQVSRLEVAAFDPSRFEGAREKVEAQGIEILTNAQLPERFEDWDRKYWKLNMETWKDVPLPDPPTQVDFEQFMKDLLSPNYDPNLHLAAVDGDELVGLTGFWISLAEPKKLYTGLTGVLRSHRRRGIATALKVIALEMAKERGTETLETDNEENNPMYLLNVELGFEPTPAWMDFTKKLREPDASADGAGGDKDNNGGP